MDRKLENEMKQIRTILIDEEEAAKVLAKWVAKRTGGKVTEVGNLVDGQFRFVLEEEDFEESHEE